MVASAGFEPACSFERGVLSAMCLPVSPRGRFNEKGGRFNRNRLFVICLSENMR